MFAAIPSVVPRFSAAAAMSARRSAADSGADGACGAGSADGAGFEVAVAFSFGGADFGSSASLDFGWTIFNDDDDDFFLIMVGAGPGGGPVVIVFAVEDVQPICVVASFTLCFHGSVSQRAR